MFIIKKSWEQIKSTLGVNHNALQYEEDNDTYRIYLANGPFILSCDIDKMTELETKAEFETFYKQDANKPLFSFTQEGKPNVIASSRPYGTETYFTTCGDDTDIGNGKRMEWDFSNSDDEVTAPTGFKRKRMDLTFIDPIYIKEGSLYYHNAPKGCYGDCYVVCPIGGWFYTNAGALAQASEPTIIFHYVNKHPIQGSVPMGDELNTEETQINPIFPGYILRIEITTPDTDTLSNGVVEFESFRARTVTL
jgi:hypothetical protein